MEQEYRAERVETRFCVVLTVQPLFCFHGGGKAQGETNREKIIAFYLAPDCCQTLFITISRNSFVFNPFECLYLF